MARLAHAARTTSAPGALLLLGALAACSVNQSGLGSGAEPSAGGGSGSTGVAGTRGAGAAGTGGRAGGGGMPGSGVAGSGAAGNGAAGNGAAANGAAGSGAAGSGAAGSGVAGDTGVGGDQPGGSDGSAGIGGATGGSAGGDGGAAGDATGVGGVAGTGVGGSTAGAGGVGGAAAGGRGGTGGGGLSGRGGAGGFAGGGPGGRGGTGGTVSCTKYPNATAFTTPTDGKGHCYWLHTDKQTWPTARMRCQNDGGDLVTILSPEENQFVLSIGRFTNSPPELWLGGTDGKLGTDKSGPGTYRWVTNETWSYTDWNLTPPAQPDGFCDPCSNGQTCTCDHRTTMAMDGTWYDFWQDNPRAYVCEATP